MKVLIDQNFCAADVQETQRCSLGYKLGEPDGERCIPMVPPVNISPPLSRTATRVWIMLLNAILVLGLSDSSVAQDAAFPSFWDTGRQANYGGSTRTLFRWTSESSAESAGGPDLNEPLVTDRPDFTEASSTVGRRVAQLELGYTFSFDDAAGTKTRSHSFPEPLLRYVIAQDWLELRLGWNYASESMNGLRADGAEDVYLGAKLGLTAQDGFLPEMALVPQMTVPTGATAFTANELLPGVNWLYGWDINDFVSTAGSTQFNRAIDEGTGRAYTEWAQSWTVGYSLTDRVGAYTEWYGFFPHSSDTAKPEHYFNGGFTFLLTDDIQWDVRAGVGLNDAADDGFVGTGLSIRFR